MSKNTGHPLLTLFAWASWTTGSPIEHLAGDGMFRHFRPLFRGHLMASVEMSLERGNRLISEGLADSIAFGRQYIANPDLVQRLEAGAPLNEVD